MRGCFKVFVVIATIIGFIVDLAAFIQLVGIDVIVTPAMGPSRPVVSPITIGIPVNIKLLTFLIWLYTAVAVFIYFVINIEWYDFWGWDWLLPLPFFIIVCVSLVIWLWVFGYLSSWFYVFLVPTASIIGASLYALLLGVHDVEHRFLKIFAILFVPIGPAILWFQSSYDWSLLRIVGITIASWLVGTMSVLLPIGGGIFVVSKILFDW